MTFFSYCDIQSECSTMSQKEPVKIMLKISEFKKKIISWKNLKLQKNLHNAACVKVCRKSPGCAAVEKSGSRNAFSMILVCCL